MILAVADVETRAQNEHAMRTRQLAGAWVAVGAVPPLSRTHDRADRIRLEIDGADHMIFGVRDVEQVAAAGNALGTVRGEPGAPNFAISAGPPSPS